MKKLLIYILLLSSICIGCFQSTLGMFMMTHASQHEMETSVMSHDIIGHGEMGAENDCGEDMHECCISPFTDSTTPTYVLYTKNDTKEDCDDGDIDDEAIALGNQLQTSIEKLNSPPLYYSEDKQYIYSKSEYLHLVGIIRNNA